MPQTEKALMNSVVESKRDSSPASQIARATQGLRAMLLNGEFRPGERIAEIPVAAKLGVSRSPLRLALEKLEPEGLIKAIPNGGFAACGFTIDDVWDAIETRGVLEGAAARFAAERDLTTRQLEPLRKINQQADDILHAGVDVFLDKYPELNKAFHAHIVALSGNKMLKRALQGVNEFPFIIPARTQLLFKILPEAAKLIPLAQEHHHSLADAIERRQGARAESIAREHSWLTRRNLELAAPDWYRIRSFPGAKMITFYDPKSDARFPTDGRSWVPNNAKGLPGSFSRLKKGALSK